MKRIYIAILLSVSVLLEANAQLAATKIDSLAQATLKETATTGAYLSVSQHDSVIFSSAFGYNDLTTKSRLTDSTLFPISSNTKAFNSILAAQLAEQGKLAFDKPLKTYLPELEFKEEYISRQVTLTDLLTHRLGIPRYDFTYFMLSEAEKRNPNRAVFDKIKYLDTSSSFRSRFQYGNNQYILAAFLLEKLTNTKWEDQLSRQILQPLGMQDTHCDLQAYQEDPDKSLGYQDGKVIDIRHVASMYEVSGMGNMFSSIRDLEKWASFLLRGNEDILSKPYIDHTLKGQFALGYEEPYPGFSSVEYALGWFVFDYFGHKVALHHGDNIGHQSLIVLLPDDNVSWVMVANEGFSAKSFAFRMTFSLLDLYLEKELNNWNELVPVYDEVYYRYPDSARDQSSQASQPLSVYTGSYAHPGFGTIEITETNQKLHIRAGSYSGELDHYEYDSFRNYSQEFGEDYIVEFELNDKKEIVAFKTDLIEPTMEKIRFIKKD